MKWLPVLLGTMKVFKRNTVPPPSTRTNGIMAYTYNQGQWGSAMGLLPDAADVDELYRRLPNIGFASFEELICPAGEVRLYARDTRVGAYPFDFLCVLHIGAFYYSVLIQDIQSVLQFTREIGAARKEKPTIATALVGLSEAIRDTSLEIVLQDLHQALWLIAQDGVKLQEKELSTSPKKTPRATSKKSP